MRNRQKNIPIQGKFPTAKIRIIFSYQKKNKLFCRGLEKNRIFAAWKS